jgi:DNA-binding response OmpR family regulator
LFIYYLQENQEHGSSSTSVHKENNDFTISKKKKIDDTFNDAVLALSNFKAGMYGLILLDVKMPQINGFELCEKIR